MPFYTCLHRLPIYLTHKQLEMPGCVFSNVATDAHSADEIFVVSDQFQTEILHS